MRAIAVNKQGQYSDIQTHTLFIGKQDDFSLPVVNITVPEKELFDYESGILTAGTKYNEWLQTNTSEPNWRRDANWWHVKKDKTNTQINLETFSTINKGSNFNSLVDLRIHGTASARFPHKSLRLYPKNNSTYDFFNQEIINRTLRINLRNAGSNPNNNDAYLKDGAWQNIMSGLNFGIQRFQPTVTFINGEYNGLLNARDRLDKYYLSLHYLLPDENVDLLKGNSKRQHGKNAEHNWSNFIKFIKDKPTQEDFFNKLTTQIDLDSFIDYYIAEIFLANKDWPANNLRKWRYQNTNKPSNQIIPEDGRWRWLMYDIDHGARNDQLKTNFLTYTSASNSKDWQNAPSSTLVFRTLIKNSLISKQFIARFSDLLNTH